jgi:hypothetical protein
VTLAQPCVKYGTLTVKINIKQFIITGSTVCVTQSILETRTSGVAFRSLVGR